MTFHVELTERAPAGGAQVSLTSSSAAVLVPSTVTVSSGETEKTFGVTTAPVTNDSTLTVTATYGGVSKSRVVLIREPYMSSLSVQSVIRAGGNGKVIVRLSGRAPEGGVTVRVSSNRPSLLALPGDVTIAAGAASATLIVPAGNVRSDVAVNIISTYHGMRLVKPTIVRHFSSPTPTPTATVTATPTDEATPIGSVGPTEEPTNEPTPE